MQTGKYIKTTIRKGIGLESPNEGSKCRVHIKCFLQNGKVIEDSEKELVIGEGDSELSEILDSCLECMHHNELCQIKIHQPDPVSCECLGFDTGSDIQLCELELLDFSKAKEFWQYSPAEKIQRACHHKSKGTECFKEGKWAAAARSYSRALKMLILLKDTASDGQKDQSGQLKLACYLNLAACQGKLGHHQHVIENCSKALSLDGENMKALYRRGTAHIALNETAKAEEDLKKALQIEPGNRAVREQLSVLKQKERQQGAFYAKALSSMFKPT